MSDIFTALMLGAHDILASLATIPASAYASTGVLLFIVGIAIREPIIRGLLRSSAKLFIALAALALAWPYLPSQDSLAAMADTVSSQMSATGNALRSLVP